MAVEDWYECRWGTMRLWLSSAQVSLKRSIVVHSPATGDDHELQDNGLDIKPMRFELLFDVMPSEPIDPATRFRQFKAKVEQGDEDILVHPADGSYIARAGDLEATIDEDSNVVDVTCTFYPIKERPPIRDLTTGSTQAIGTSDVSAAAGELETQLDAVGIESTVPDVARAALDNWAALEAASDTSEVPIRTVLSDAAAMAVSIATLIEDEGLDDDNDLWPAFQAAIALQAAFRVAAIAATSETPGVFFLRVAAPTSVLALVTRVYGGKNAEDYERQVRALNDLTFVGGLLQTGTELAMPATASVRSAG